MLNMPVFRGSLWQMGHRQMGYGLGNLFRSLAKVALPMLKRGGKALRQIVATTGADLLGDIASGKMLKKPQKREVYRSLVLPKLWNKYRQTNNPKNKRKNNPVVEDAVSHQEVLNDPKADPKDQKGQSAHISEVKNAQLKRENHRDREPETVRPRNEKHLLKIYLVKNEFQRRCSCRPISGFYIMFR